MKRLSLLSFALILQSCAFQSPTLMPERNVASEPLLKDGCTKYLCVGDEALLRQGNEVNTGFGVVKDIFVKKKETYVKLELRNKQVVTERFFNVARIIKSPAGECYKTKTREYCVGDEVGIFKSQEVTSDEVTKMFIVGLPNERNSSWDLLYMNADKTKYSFGYFPIVFKQGECSGDNICIGQTYKNGFGSTDEIVGLFDDFEQWYGQGRSYLVKLGDFPYPMYKRIPLQLLKIRMGQEIRRELTMQTFHLYDQKLSASEEEVMNKLKENAYANAKILCSREFYGQGVLEEESTSAIPELFGRCKKKIETLQNCLLPVIYCPKWPTRAYQCDDVNWKYTCVHKSMK